MTYAHCEPDGSLPCGRRCAAQWLTEAASGQGVGKRHRNGWGAPPPARAEPGDVDGLRCSPSSF